MTIQQPPDSEIPNTPPDRDRDEDDRRSTGEPEQRAPGPEQHPVGAPRDEPDPQT